MLCDRFKKLPHEFADCTMMEMSFLNAGMDFMKWLRTVDGQRWLKS